MISLLYDMYGNIRALKRRDNISNRESMEVVIIRVVLTHDQINTDSSHDWRNPSPDKRSINQRVASG